MEQPALFADVVPAPAAPTKRPPKAKKSAALVPEVLHPAPAPTGSEVATVERAEGVLSLFFNQYPNPSKILRERARGQGLSFYDTMLKTDADLAGIFNDLTDDVLHYPVRVRPASQDPQHVLHARFVEFAISRVHDWQNIVRHGLSAFARGFAVLEKMYTVVDAGEWKGAVVLDQLLDKPQQWFGFDLMRQLRFRTISNNFPGEMVDQRKFAVFRFGSTANPWGDPALDYVYFPWKLKHHAFKNEALWFEKWASPTAVGQYDKGSDEKTRKANQAAMLEVIQAIQNDNGTAIPKGMLIELLESKRNGNVSFDAYIQRLTETQSRLITGQILSSMGGSGGSHALGKVHEKREANKVEMLAKWCSEELRQVFSVDLVTRNFGPQDAYPDVKIQAQSPAARQAEATILQQYQGLGLPLSKAYYTEVLDVVAPDGPDDALLPPPSAKPSQVLPVNAQLAADSARAEIRLAGYAPLHRDARAQAADTRSQLEGVAKAAAKKARPAITKVVRSLGKAAAKAGKKGLSHVRRRDVYGALPKASGVQDLGHALHGMLDPSKLALAAGDAEAPPDISYAAKLALALQMLAIAERIYQASQDAPDDADAGQFADDLTSPDGAAVDQAYGNLFEGTHSTNVASIATAKLRQQLADPKFRAQYPYVMIVATNPNVRPTHAVMDGFILSSEEARYSPFLPPFDFGCDCVPVPISAAQAVKMGLTGAAPAGTLDTFLQGKGLEPNPRGFGYKTPDGQVLQPGAPNGFQPAYPGTDENVQLEALRQKAEDLRAQDPEAWLAVQKWTSWLFEGADPLR